MKRIFGKNPSGGHKERLSQLTNFKKGVFTNQSETRVLAKGVNGYHMARDYFKRHPNRIPSGKIPSVKTDFNAFPDERARVTWLGHSTSHIYLQGKHILVDPVFCGFAAPFPGMIKAFPGSDPYNPGDFKQVDLLLLTHDHYDHLDFRTLLALKPVVKQVVCPAGVASHLTYWGWDKTLITELSWWESSEPVSGIRITALPARHFSGRLFKRAGTLWASFMIQTADHCIYVGGDSGYDTHFSEIGNAFGPIDLAILECGQYNEKWPMIHMKPEESVQAGLDLKAKISLPVHWGKFALAYHAWDEPVERFVQAAGETGLNILTPKIGEPFLLEEPGKTGLWWREV